MVVDQLKELASQGIQEIIIEKNVITQAGFDEINSLLQANKLPKIPIWFPNEWECSHDSYSGNLTKRYKKYLFYVGAKPVDTVIAKMGEIAKRHTSSESRLSIDITQSFDWKPGEYGEGRDSCFWTNKRAARGILEEANAFAVRIHEPRKGRAWIIPDNPSKGMATMFNVYWGRQPQVAEIISQKLGLSYRRWKVVNNGMSEGMLHINSGMGWLLANKGDTVPKVVDLKIPDHSVGKCVSCGKKLWDDLDQYDTREDGIHCYGCLAAEEL